MKKLLKYVELFFLGSTFFTSFAIFVGIRLINIDLYSRFGLGTDGLDMFTIRDIAFIGFQPLFVSMLYPVMWILSLYTIYRIIIIDFLSDEKKSIIKEFINKNGRTVSAVETILILLLFCFILIYYGKLYYDSYKLQDFKTIRSTLKGGKVIFLISLLAFYVFIRRKRLILKIWVFSIYLFMLVLVNPIDECFSIGGTFVDIYSNDNLYADDVLLFSHKDGFFYYQYLDAENKEYRVNMISDDNVTKIIFLPEDDIKKIKADVSTYR
jgi:hypothetical protein